MASFIASIDCLADYENLFGRSFFTGPGFALLLEYHEDMNLNLSEIGRLEHYFTEYGSLLDAAEDYLDDEVIKKYEVSKDKQILLDAFEENDINVIYDRQNGGVCIVDER